MKLLMTILIIVSIFHPVLRKILGIILIAYNIYKLLGLRKDRFDIEKVIFINGICLVFGIILLFS